MSQTDLLTPPEAEALLQVARQALTQGVTLGQAGWLPDLDALPERLCEPGASFVTLYTRGELHGCIGSVTPRQALAEDLAQNAVSAANNDPRFPPLDVDELAETAIEVSVLSPLQEVDYRDLDDLMERIRPGVDGVMVEQGWKRGLLLPQVWDKLPDCYEFLAHVAIKAHTDISIYDAPDAEVYIFQVHHYSQPAPKHIDTLPASP